MNLRRVLVEEARSIAIATAYFAAWFLLLITLKTLVLEEYRIRFSGLATALVGALVAAKVVVVLRHVNLLGPIERGPAWLWVAGRTVLYTLCVLAAAALERAFEMRAEHGGFVEALRVLVREAQGPHVFAVTLGAGLAMFVLNVIEVVRRHLGGDALQRVFSAPIAPDRHDADPEPARAAPAGRRGDSER